MALYVTIKAISCLEGVFYEDPNETSDNREHLRAEYETGYRKWAAVRHLLRLCALLVIACGVIILLGGLGSIALQEPIKMVDLALAMVPLMIAALIGLSMFAELSLYASRTTITCSRRGAGCLTSCWNACIGQHWRSRYRHFGGARGGGGPNGDQSTLVSVESGWTDTKSGSHVNLDLDQNAFDFGEDPDVQHDHTTNIEMDDLRSSN